MCHPAAEPWSRREDQKILEGLATVITPSHSFLTVAWLWLVQKRVGGPVTTLAVACPRRPEAA